MQGQLAQTGRVLYTGIYLPCWLASSFLPRQPLSGSLPAEHLDFFWRSSVLQREQMQMLLPEMPKPGISYSGKNRLIQEYLLQEGGVQHELN